MIPQLSTPSIKVVYSSTTFRQSGSHNSRSQKEYELLRHGQLDFIDVTPGPLITWLEGSHHRMLRIVKVSRGVTAR
jgi:hypothetical protein